MTHDSAFPIAPQALLAEEDFIRGVVRDLIRDPDRVDDIVQQTWVQALTKPPRISGGLRSLRGWLARVARNKATDELRAAKRRQLHEEQVQPREALPTPAEILERESERQKVVEAVLSLGEPYRTTLLLRYYDSLNAPQIAERMQASPAAVRTRISRGLEMLRARLDDVHGGNRRAWMLALAPLVAPHHLVLGAGASASAGGSVVSTTFTKGALLTTMTTNARLLIAAGVLLAGGLGWVGLDWINAEDPTDGGPRSGTAVATEEEASRSGTNANAASDAGKNDAAADTTQRQRLADLPWQLAGTIIENHGARLAAFRIRLDVYQGFVAPLGPGGAIPDALQPLLTTEVMTDAQGVFQWGHEQPAGNVTIRFRPGNGEHASGSKHIVVTKGEQPPQDTNLRFLLLDGLVEGRVTDEAGHPIAGATVHWYTYTKTKTDEDGYYKLRMPAGRLPVMCRAAGYAGQSLAVHMRREVPGVVGSGGVPVKHARKDFVLKQGFRVSGIVQDEAGKPIAGARVHNWRTYWQPTRTDTKGRFELDSLTPGRDQYSISTHHRDFVQGHADVKPEQPEVTITMRSGARLSGRVVDPHGQAVEGALVYARTAALNNSEPDAVSGADGTFTVRAMRSDTFQVSARKRGYALAMQKVAVPEEGEVEQVELQLAKANRLQGIVTDPNGRPLANATVHFSVDGDLDTSLGSDVRTDKAGRFVGVNLPDKPLTVLGMRKGYQRRETGGHRPGGPEVRIVLHPEAALAGRVLDGNTGKPLTRFRVRLIWPTLREGEHCGLFCYSGGLNDPGYTVEQADGYWQINDEDFSAGVILAVAIDAPGYGTQILDRLRTAGTPDADAHVARLYPEMTITGKLHDEATGQPVAGAKVEIAPERERGFGFFSPRGDTVRSEADGSFRIDRAGPNSYRITVRAAGYLPARLKGIRVGQGPGTIERTIPLRRGAVVAGELHGAGNAWASGVSMVLKPLHQGEDEDVNTRSLSTDTRGRFSFENVKDGTYLLGPLVEDLDLPAWEKTVRVAGRKSVTGLVLSMQPLEGSCTLTGSLTCAERLPAACTVILYPDPDHYKDVPRERRPSLRRQRATGGMFRFESLAAGFYRLSIWAKGESLRFSGRKTVEVQGTKRTEVAVKASKLER